MPKNKPKIKYIKMGKNLSVGFPTMIGASEIRVIAKKYPTWVLSAITEFCVEEFGDREEAFETMEKWLKAEYIVQKTTGKSSLENKIVDRRD